MISSDRKDGYDELIDPELGANQASVTNLLEEEESKLLNDEDIIDDTLFKGLDKNHPLY